MNRKIRDLKIGNLFIHPQSKQICVLSESHLEMGEKPYTTVFGQSAGETGYFESDMFDTEVELFDPRYEPDFDMMKKLGEIVEQRQDLFTCEQANRFTELSIYGGCACPTVHQQNGTPDPFSH